MLLILFPTRERTEFSEATQGLCKNKCHNLTCLFARSLRCENSYRMVVMPISWPT